LALTISGPSQSLKPLNWEFFREFSCGLFSLGPSRSARDAVSPREIPRQNGSVAVVDISEERRKRRRVGDPHLSEVDREILARITFGDLVDEFPAALDADLVADPILGGHDHDDA
jgi:hypothetical protein